MQQITGFDWDEANIEHIWQHGVEPEKAEEVLLGNPLVRRARGKRYMALGETMGGYRLVRFGITHQEASALIKLANRDSLSEVELVRRWVGERVRSEAPELLAA